MLSLTDSKKRKPKELRIHCDEAGRGPLAGPVTVGCALMLTPMDLSAYKDSKQLTKKQRDVLYEQICSPLGQRGARGDLLCSTGRSSAEEIDNHGIIPALNLACRRGIGELLKTYYTHVLKDQLLHSDFGEDILAIRLYDELFSAPITEDTILHFVQIPNSYAYLAGLVRDGNHTFGLDRLLHIPVVTIIKGDQKNPLISVASIVAKVERDRYMEQISSQFPGYQFVKHKGYGTQLHRDLIKKHGLSTLHRATYCKNFTKKKATPSRKNISKLIGLPGQAPDQAGREVAEGRRGLKIVNSQSSTVNSSKPALLLHICCAPDLSRPLHWLKEHFKLYLFWYNPNIHPRKEHEQRYSQFLKLVGLEPGDYEILEDRYDPKEFFAAMIDQKESIDPGLVNASDKIVLKQAGEMEERSDRCNPCYSMRLEMAARMASKQGIRYFTSTLLISPKKKMDKLFRRGKESELTYPGTKFLWFDFPKNGGYDKASELTRMHGLRRQNYCGCGRTIPKPGEKKASYHGG